MAFNAPCHKNAFNILPIFSQTNGNFNGEVGEDRLVIKRLQKINHTAEIHKLLRLLLRYIRPTGKQLRLVRLVYVR